VNINKKTDKLLESSIHALWKCKAPFTKEDIVRELKNENIVLNDFNAFKELFKDILIEENSMFRIDVTKSFNYLYK
jgi:hypothetical protein